MSQLQNDVILYLLNEMERLNLLMQRLQERGVVQATDVALSALQAQLKQEERRLSLAVQHADRESVSGSQARMKRLAAQIEALTV
jgi:hypothetical protein